MITFNTKQVTKNTTSRDLEALSADCPEVKLQEKSVEYTQNAEYEVVPDEGYDGLSNVNVKVDYKPKLQNVSAIVNYPEDHYYLPSYEDHPSYGLYDGYGTVNISFKGPQIEDIKYTSIYNITAGSQTVNPSDGYDAMKSVSITLPPIDNSVDYAVTENGNYTIRPTVPKVAMQSVNLTVNVPSKEEETKSVSYTANGSYTVQPTEGKTLSEVSVEVNVPSSGKEEIDGQITIDDPASNNTYHFTAPTGKVWKSMDIKTPVQFKIDLQTGLKCRGSIWTTLPKIINPARGSDSLKEMFRENVNLQTADLSELDFGTATNLDYFLQGCSALTDLTLPTADTSQIITMGAMFSGCSSLEFIIFPSSWNTENVQEMWSMFSGCSSLTSLNLETFNTKSLTSMYGMFRGCSAIKTMQFGNNFFQTSSDTLAEYDFSDLINWDQFLSTTLINALPEGAVYKSIKVSATTYAALDEDDRTAATVKGWTINQA